SQLSARRERGIHASRESRPHPLARLRARRRRDARVRNGRRGRRRRRAQVGAARRASRSIAAGRNTCRQLGRSWPNVVANWRHHGRIRGSDRNMSQQKSGMAVGAPAAEPLPEATIADYLRSHPDFFERHGALLLGLKLPHRTNGAAVSLVERQVSMLRQRNAQLERQFKDLVAVAKANDALVEKIHQLGLRLMHAANAPAKLEALETSLREDFAAERAVLVLFEETAPADAVRDGFVKRLSANDADVRPFTAFLKAGRPRCGPLRD